MCLQTLQIRQGASDRWKKSVMQSTYSLLRHDNYFLWTPADVGVTWGGGGKERANAPTLNIFLIFIQTWTGTMKKTGVGVGERDVCIQGVRVRGIQKYMLMF